MKERNSTKLLNSSLCLLLLALFSSVCLCSEQGVLSPDANFLEIIADESLKLGLIELSSTKDKPIATTETTTDTKTSTNAATRSLGDGTCDPVCENGGYCEKSICYCPGFYDGAYCQISDPENTKINLYVFISICLGAFLLGLMISICCTMLWEVRKVKKEESGKDMKRRMRWRLAEDKDKVDAKPAAATTTPIPEKK